MHAYYDINSHKTAKILSLLHSFNFSSKVHDSGSYLSGGRLLHVVRRGAGMGRDGGDGAGDLDSEGLCVSVSGDTVESFDVGNSNHSGFPSS